MLGWKTVERIIEPAVSFDEATQTLQEHGFTLHASNPSHAVFKSRGSQNPWTTFAPDGETVPIELAVAESHKGLFVQIRYDTFVAFDTGDLPRFGDQIAAILTPTAADA